MTEEQIREHKKRFKKTKQKLVEKKQTELVMAKFSSEGFSTKSIENEAFIKFIKSILQNKSDYEYTKVDKTGKKEENESLLMKLRDMDRFEDIISHLVSLSPPIFTGEYKKIKT